MGLRPGHCYGNEGLEKDRAYCRLAVTVHSKNYIGTAPGLKIRQFNMGNPTKEFSHILDLCIDDTLQIRDNAVEAMRQTIVRFLLKKLGKDGYFIRIRSYPYHILRENKQAQGAHADRIQKGMSHGFGKPTGRAIRTRPGMKLLSILVDEPNIAIAKDSILRVKAKLPCALHVEVGTDVHSIGARPRFIKEIAETTVVAATEIKEGETVEAGKTDVKGTEAKAGAKADAKAGGKTEAKTEAKGAATGKADAKAAPKKK